MLDTLRTELTTDPLGRGYAGMTASDVLASLRTPNRTRPVPIPSAELLAWASASGRYSRLVAARENPQLADAVRSLAWGAVTLIERTDTRLDLSRPDRVALLAALVAAEVLTADDADSLNALAAESISRLEELGLAGVELKHVVWIREGLR